MSRVEHEDGLDTTYNEDGTIFEIKRVARTPAASRMTVTCPTCGAPGKVAGQPCKYCKS
jgi:DnaJ-class molecular chaperone